MVGLAAEFLSLLAEHLLADTIEKLERQRTVVLDEGHVRNVLDNCAQVGIDLLELLFHITVLRDRRGMGHPIDSSTR